jgi:hypothetical protein
MACGHEKTIKMQEKSGIDPARVVAVFRRGTAAWGKLSDDNGKSFTALSSTKIVNENIRGAIEGHPIGDKRTRYELYKMSGHR